MWCQNNNFIDKQICVKFCVEHTTTLTHSQTHTFNRNTNGSMYTETIQMFIGHLTNGSKYMDPWPIHTFLQMAQQHWNYEEVSNFKFAKLIEWPPVEFVDQMTGQYCIQQSWISSSQTHVKVLNQINNEIEILFIHHSTNIMKFCGGSERKNGRAVGPKDMKLTCENNKLSAFIGLWWW